MTKQRRFSINYVPWDTLQEFRCKEIEELLKEHILPPKDCKHGDEDAHQWTVGGYAYYVPTELHATFIAIAQDNAREYLRERGFLPTIRYITILDDNLTYAPKACGRAVK